LEKQWSLESFGVAGARVDFVVAQLPCRIGRSKENDLVIATLGLSRFHATLTRDISGQLRLIDESSSNGTFVNRQRIEGYCLLKENDIIHFASAEFRLRRNLVDQREATSFDEMRTMIMPRDMDLPERFMLNEAEFEELILGHGMSGAAQPIVDAHTRSIVGYELLGRSDHPQLPNTPIELFGLAAAMDREVDLSMAFREFSFRQLAPRVMGLSLFINVHPKETFSEGFITSLEHFRRSSPELKIVVEIHESAVTDIEKLRELANRLAQMDVRFAYDDFGAGQARLLELADVPAHFVKFDRALVFGLHKASQRKQQLVRDLVKMVLAMGSVPLAEGVEDEEDARICVDMGFQLIQGYLTGRPIRVESL
jgi:EAL domain-containing protein (putative c-di-GMP-specific phosphodiesterase class I)